MTCKVVAISAYYHINHFINLERPNTETVRITLRWTNIPSSGE